MPDTPKDQDKKDGHEETAPKTDDATGGDDKPKDGGEKKTEEPKFTQAQMDAVIAERLAREKRKHEEDAKAAADAAEGKALEDNKKFEELAQKRAEQIAALTANVEKATADLEAATAKAKATEAALESFNEARIQAIPEALRPAIQEAVAQMDAVAKGAYLNKHAEALGAKADVLSGFPDVSPKSRGNGDLTDKQRREMTAVTGRL